MPIVKENPSRFWSGEYNSNAPDDPDTVSAIERKLELDTHSGPATRFDLRKDLRNVIKIWRQVRSRQNGSDES